MINVLMADDHPILREGIKQLFNWAGDIVASGEASNGKQVIEQLSQSKYDILLMDMSMPPPNGVDLINIITAKMLELPILVLSMYNDPQIAKMAIQAGAHGYVSKDSNPEVLLTAIRKVASGGSYICPSLAYSIGQEDN